MAALRVLTTFRDINNFFLMHKEGDVIEVTNPVRVARLLAGGICELVEEKPAANEKQPYIAPIAIARETAYEKPRQKRPYNRKKKTE